MTLTMKVAVAGAGVGGLCLAQGLLKAGLEVAVYERDQALDAGGQGYRLHLDAARSRCEARRSDERCVHGQELRDTDRRLRPLREDEIVVGPTKCIVS